MIELTASVLLVLGAALTLLAAVGFLRFPDVLTRMHAATKPALPSSTRVRCRWQSWRWWRCCSSSPLRWARI
jgi:multicomponent Na+:H+ antiporter subunit G